MSVDDEDGVVVCGECATVAMTAEDNIIMNENYFCMWSSRRISVVGKGYFRRVMRETGPVVTRRWLLRS
jgi:hypothetical protein